MTTARCDCEWVLDVSWSRAGESGTPRVDDNGRPFRTAASTAVRTYCYDEGDPRGYADVRDAANVARLCRMRALPPWLLAKWEARGATPADVAEVQRQVELSH